jgi:phosphatidylglycerophosphate synthase
MEIDKASANRRPLKSRGTQWAATATRLLLATGISANGVSLAGIAISVAGAAALSWGPTTPLLFIVAAICVQLRLLANLLDGLVAVEGGRGGPTGAIFNEFPDRLEDSLFLVAAGYAAGAGWLGWLAALLAAICAYVRLLGGSLGHAQDFGGPMAKPHRMAALTVACVAAAPEAWLRGSSLALLAGLAVIAAGTALTIALRVERLARQLREAR